MSSASSVPDTVLGLSASEIQILRQQQHVALQHSLPVDAASRGRRNGSSSSQPSSRAASVRSGRDGQGRVFLDPDSLQQLIAHFEHLMMRIHDRVDVLQNATQQSVQASHHRAARLMQNADAEIARMRRIIAEIDALEAEFERVKHIREVIRHLKARVDRVEARLRRGQPPHAHRRRHRSPHRSDLSILNPPLGRQGYDAQAPTSQPGGSFRPLSPPAIFAPISPPQSRRTTTVSASRRSSSHSSHRLVSTTSISSPLTSITSFGTALQQFTELYEDVSPILGAQLIAGIQVRAESSERGREAGRSWPRESAAPHPGGDSVAESPAIATNESDPRQECHGQTPDADSPCPSLSTHGEVDTDSGESVTGSTYANFSPDVAHELASLVRHLVSFWFYRVWPNVRDSTANPFRSCPRGAENADTSSGASQTRGGPSAPQNARGRVTKRNRKDTDADDSGDHGKKRGKRNRSHSSGDVMMLACPFSKYDPLRYSDVNITEREYRGCSTPCLKDISRLKYDGAAVDKHLYRVHCPPKYYCSSCYQTFDCRETLDAHTRHRPSCEVREPKFTEKMSESQITQVKKKQFKMSVTENWFFIFETIFPNHPRPSSPYLDDTFQLGVQSYLSYYRELISNGLIEWLHLDIYGQAAVQLVLDNSQEQVIRRLAQERTSVRVDAELGPLPRDGDSGGSSGGGVDNSQNLEPLENDPAAFAMIEGHLNGFPYLTEPVGTSSQPPSALGPTNNHHPMHGLLEPPPQAAYLDVAPPPVITVPEYDAYPLPLPDNPDASKEVDRTFLASYDEEYIFQS